MYKENQCNSTEGHINPYFCIRPYAKMDSTINMLVISFKYGLRRENFQVIDPFSLLLPLRENRGGDLR